MAQAHSGGHHGTTAVFGVLLNREMLVYLLALAAAFVNALSSVLQRRAAAPASHDNLTGLELAWYLLRRPAWFGSIAAMSGSFGLQAAALSQGSVAEVQPVLATELLFGLAILAVRFHRPIGRLEWLGGSAIVGGLVLFLAAGQPTAGRPGHTGPLGWVLAGAATLGVDLSATILARRGSPNRQAALIGSAGGVTFALTATVMAAFTDAISRHGPGVFAGWTPYAVAGCGLGATWLSNNAFERGAIPAAQPALTIVDPLVSILLGVALFGVRLHAGGLIVAEVAGLLVLVAGVVTLSRSPLASGRTSEESELQGSGT